MLKRLTRLCISLLFFIFQEMAIGLLSLLGRRPARLCILTYHQVRAAEQRAFRTQIEQILRCGIPVFADFSPPHKAKGRFIAITFDDFLAEALEIAGTILRQREIPSTWFVISGRLGGKVDWIRNCQHANSSASVGSLEALLRLDPALFQIASHTTSHGLLTEMSQSEAFSELAESMESLTKLTAAAITSISFPYGEYDTVTLELARKAGYRLGFSNVAVFPQSAGGFLRGRVSVEPWDWPLEFWLKIRGAYNWQAFIGFWRHHLMSSSDVSVFRVKQSRYDS